MKIITALNLDFGFPVAFTEAEWKALPPDEQDLFDEWVWQEQPTKEAATLRHDEAHDLWSASVEAGNDPTQGTY